ncbi:MAG: helix-turn-helix transcriptional regulator [Brachyspira sp.]|jgi:transcriptional regulator, XRE family|nr:helix-turn-helix transcriptional regulator [Brachyspira sp.]CCY24785.1 transcriptional regulator XRE family [Brachyspira sp. CAG:484]
MDNDNKKLLGKRIKELRRNKGYTQEQLSELVGIETSSLSGIESGRFFPSLHVLDKMANVLRIQLADFFNFFTVDIPENLDEEISNIISSQDNNNKKIIYKLLKAGFSKI